MRRGAGAAVRRLLRPNPVAGLSRVRTAARKALRRHSRGQPLRLTIQKAERPSPSPTGEVTVQRHTASAWQGDEGSPALLGLAAWLASLSPAAGGELGEELSAVAAQGARAFRGRSLAAAHSRTAGSARLLPRRASRPSCSLRGGAGHVRRCRSRRRPSVPEKALEPSLPRELSADPARSGCGAGRAFATLRIRGEWGRGVSRGGAGARAARYPAPSQLSPSTPRLRAPAPRITLAFPLSQPSPSSCLPHTIPGLRGGWSLDGGAPAPRETGFRPVVGPAFLKAARRSLQSRVVGSSPGLSLTLAASYLPGLSLHL